MRGRIVFWALAVLGSIMPACGSKTGPCKDDYDCDGAEVCKKATGACEPFRCREDADCLDPRLRCDDNECVPR